MALAGHCLEVLATMLHDDGANLFTDEVMEKIRTRVVEGWLGSCISACLRFVAWPSMGAYTGTCGALKRGFLVHAVFSASLCGMAVGLQ